MVELSYMGLWTGIIISKYFPEDDLPLTFTNCGAGASGGSKQYATKEILSNMAGISESSLWVVLGDVETNSEAELKFSHFQFQSIFTSAL